MEDCIFCKIVSGSIPAHKVYEDDDILAFLDINPVNPGHTLVITKDHHSTLLDLPEDLAEKVMAVTKKITPAILSGVGAKAFNLGLNQGEIAGQVVDHFHFHIMPRFEGDGHQLFKGKEYEEGEAEEVLSKIKNNL
jgi:histidine triad (HIT) family protein